MLAYSRFYGKIMVTKKRTEVAIQFEQIYEEWNDPEKRALRKLEKNKEERRERHKEDNGL